MVKVRAMRTIENALRRWGFSRIAGCDEVGRGCLAGPVVAAAVVLDPNRHIAGIFDSKMITAAERDRLNADIQEILDRQTDAWGIKVANVEIKHVDLNESMVRAIARQAEAERLRRARVINAEGEQQAAAKLVEAGAMLARQPNAMQLRYFNALNDIASDKVSTFVFPLPLELFRKFTDGGPTE